MTQSTGTKNDAKPRRVGLLTVHGMGQQLRFQQLAELAWALMGEWHLQGLLSFLWQQAHQSFLSALEGVYRTEQFTHRGYVDTKVVLNLDKSEGNGDTASQDRQPVELHIMELYWAPLSQNSVTLFQVLVWIGRSVLAPLRNFTAMKRTAGTKEYPRYVGLVLLYLLVILVIVVLALSMIWTAWQMYEIAAWNDWLGRAAQWLFHVEVQQSPGLLHDLLAFLQKGDWSSSIKGASLVVLVLMISGGIYILGGSVSRELRGPKRIGRIAIYVITLLPLLVSWYFTTRQLIITGWWPLFLLFLLHQGWRLVRTALVSYMGDVLVYAQSNEIAGTYPVRRKITQYAVERLEYIVGHDVRLRMEGKPCAADIIYDSPRPDFDEIILLGHSLGSVVLYDALNEYWSKLQELDQENQTDWADDFADRLKLVLTYGSPLDKMRYFFSRQKNGNPVLDDLRRGGRLACDESAVPGDLFHEARWVNLWCMTDIVSGPLDDYGDGIKNHHVPGLWPWLLVNHNMYLKNPWVRNLLDHEIRDLPGD